MKRSPLRHSLPVFLLEARPTALSAVASLDPCPLHANRKNRNTSKYNRKKHRGNQKNQKNQKIHNHGFGWKGLGVGGCPTEPMVVNLLVFLFFLVSSVFFFRLHLEGFWFFRFARKGQGSREAKTESVVCLASTIKQSLVGGVLGGRVP